MPELDINPLGYLFDSTYDLARVLVIVAAIVAVTLVVRRRFLLGAAFAGVSASLVLIAWDVKQVTSTDAILTTVHGPLSENNPANDYMKLDLPQSYQLIQALSVLLILFVGYQIIRAFRAKMKLTGGFGVVAVVALLAVLAEQLRNAGELSSPFWNFMRDANEIIWTVLLVAVFGYAVYFIAVVSSRLARRDEQKKTGSSVDSAAPIVAETTAH